ncbi:MAG: glycoside hydrolase family 127 protein, partial [Caldilineaceae bacterium]
GNYFYSTGARSLWVHLYGQSTVNTQINGMAVQLRQETNYPWDGAIKLTVTPEQTRPFTLHLRIPGWCPEWAVTVNGAPLRMELPPQDGYLAITRAWAPGDTVELNLAMPVQTVWAHPAVHQMQGRFALQRGPIVYCAEGVDNGIVNLDRILLDPTAVDEFTVVHKPDLLGGVTVIQAPGQLVSDDGWNDKLLYRYDQPSQTDVAAVTAVPYAVWDNRDAGEMRVWFRAK